MGAKFGGVHVGCHCWVPLLANTGVPLLSGCHCWVSLLGCHRWGAIAVDASYEHIGGVPLLACHCWLPLLGAIAGVPLLGAIAGAPLLGCHYWVPLCDAMAGCHHCWMPAEFTIAGCHAGVPLLGAIARKIDQSVTPFSAAPFSTLITNKLACAMWGLC